MATLTILSKTPCPQCTSSYRKLDKLGVPYNISDASDDEKREIGARYNYSQAPVVLVTDESGEVIDHWSGFRPDKIEAFAKGLEGDQPLLLAA